MRVLLAAFAMGNLEHGGFLEMRKFADQNKMQWMSEVQLDADPSSCGVCVKDVAEGVMKVAGENLKESCIHTDSIRYARMCRVMGEHPGETIGALLYWLRPVSAARMYCLGKGVCSSYDEAEVADALGPEYAFTEDGTAESLVHMNELVMNATTNRMYGGERHFDMKDGDPKKEFMQCVLKGSAIVMHKVAAHVEKACLETKCPKQQRICKWAGEHRDVAGGILLAHVEPWKYAMGGCVVKARQQHLDHAADTAETSEETASPKVGRFARLKRLFRFLQATDDQEPIAATTPEPEAARSDVTRAKFQRAARIMAKVKSFFV